MASIQVVKVKPGSGVTLQDFVICLGRGEALVLAIELLKIYSDKKLTRCESRTYLHLSNVIRRGKSVRCLDFDSVLFRVNSREKSSNIFPVEVFGEKWIV